MNHKQQKLLIYSRVVHLLQDWGCDDAKKLALVLAAEHGYNSLQSVLNCKPTNYNQFINLL